MLANVISQLKLKQSAHYKRADESVKNYFVFNCIIVFEWNKEIPKL